MCIKGVKLAIILCSITIGGLTSGCVSKSKYNQALSQSENYQQRMNESQQRLSNLRQQLRDTHASIGIQSEGELTEEQMIADIRNQLMAIRPEVGQPQNENQLAILAKHLFPSGSAKLTPDGMRVLEKVATWIKSFEGQQVFIEGYTDTVPIAASYQDVYGSNWDLSAARSVSVLRFLVDQGVNESRLVALGYGEHNPVAQGEDESSLEQNRRVEIKLFDGELKEGVATLPQNLPVSARIDINQATVAELVVIPGVTPQFARNVVEYRDRAGRVSSMDELRQVRGFDQVNVQAFQSMVRFDDIGSGAYGQGGQGMGGGRSNAEDQSMPPTDSGMMPENQRSGSGTQAPRMAPTSPDQNTPRSTAPDTSIPDAKRSTEESKDNMYLVPKDSDLSEKYEQDQDRR